MTGYLYKFFILLAAISPGAYGQDLLEVYELALQNDPVLKQAYASQLAIGETKNQSVANFLPNVSAAGVSNMNHLVNKRATYQGLGDQKYNDTNFILNLSQPLFHWEHWVQLDQSDNQIAQAEADYQAELQKLMMKVAESYFNVLSAEDDLGFIRAEKQAISRQLEQAKQRYNIGLIDIAESHQAQAAYDIVVADEIEAVNRIDNQKSALTEIIGMQDISLNLLGETIPLLRPEPDNLAEWLDSAELGNFGIISAFNQMEVARKTIELERTGHYPQLDLVASMGEYDTSSRFGLKGSNEMVGLKLNVPIFQGGEVNSKVQQASYRYEQAKERLSSAKRAVNRQVSDAYRGIITSISRVAALKSAVESAEVAVQETEAGFDVGVRAFVEVLDEQKNLYRAKRNYSRARYDYLLNGIKLKQATSNLDRADIEKINQLLMARSPAKAE